MASPTQVGAAERVQDSDPFNIPNLGLATEKVVHGDVGLRFHDDRWRAELVAFRLRYTDRIVSVGTGQVTANGRDVVQSVNAASSSLHGAEAVFNVSVTDRIRLETAMNYTRGKQYVAGIGLPGRFGGHGAATRPAGSLSS